MSEWMNKAKREFFDYCEEHGYPRSCEECPFEDSCESEELSWGFGATAFGKTVRVRVKTSNCGDCV